MKTKTNYFIIHCVLITAILPALLISCGIFRGGGKAAPDMLAGQSKTLEEYERLLDIAIRERIAQVGTDSTGINPRFESRKPYFYKTAEFYPQGSDKFKTDIQATESRTIPYRAQITLEKVRFATRLHRNKDQARNDDNFYRHTGTETLSYEMRNGQWIKAGSFFVAELSEYKDATGQWARVEHAVGPSLAETAKPKADKGGWVSRSLGRIKFW